MGVHESVARSRWAGLRANCWEAFSVAATLGVWLVVSASAAATAVCVIGLAVLHVTADPKPQEEAAEVRGLRVRCDSLERELDKRDKRIVTLEVELDTLRRGAILLPRRDDLKPDDLIPPQQVPTTPEE